MKGGGRRGRRTGAMVRIAHERIDDLFVLAARESEGGHPELANRYVVLARKIGTRYNVRLLPEYRELYCRSCSSYWVEGRTVRTRLRAGRRVRTCLVCGRPRRGVVRPRRVGFARLPPEVRVAVAREEGAPVESFVDVRPAPEDEREEE